MATFEQIINILIPIIIAVIGIYLLGRPLRKPLSALWGGIVHLINMIRGKSDEVKQEYTQTIEYS